MPWITNTETIALDEEGQAIASLQKRTFEPEKPGYSTYRGLKILMPEYIREYENSMVVIPTKEVSLDDKQVAALYKLLKESFNE